MFEVDVLNRGTNVASVREPHALPQRRGAQKISKARRMPIRQTAQLSPSDMFSAELLDGWLLNDCLSQGFDIRIHFYGSFKQIACLELQFNPKPSVRTPFTGALENLSRDQGLSPDLNSLPSHPWQRGEDRRMEFESRTESLGGEQ